MKEKIIHILVGKANPNTMNGVNKVVHNISTEQTRLGLDVEVWGITKSPKSINHQHNYVLKLFQATKFRFLLDKELIKKISLLSGRAVIFHLHSVFLPELYAVSQQLRKYRLPWVLSPHSGYNPNSLKKNKVLKSSYMNMIEKKLIVGARRIHAIGKTEVYDLLQINKELDIVLIPNGQELSDVQFTAVSTEEPNEYPVFGFCGRLAKEHKGLDLLILGFSLYKKSGGKGVLWLIGDGQDKVYLEQLVANECQNRNIKFLGTMFSDHKLSYMSKMDFFVHTSRWEGLPTAVLEAMALGIPVLVSEETNMGSYVKKYNNGLVLIDKQPSNICSALKTCEQIFKSAAYQSLAEASNRAISEELNWQVITKSINEELYG